MGLLNLHQRQCEASLLMEILTEMEQTDIITTLFNVGLMPLQGNRTFITRINTNEFLFSN